MIIQLLNLGFKILKLDSRNGEVDTLKEITRGK